MALMDIGKVAKQSGLPASTLRYYEQKGLIQSKGREGLRRLFDANVIERLALISLGRSVGFSLDEIAVFFTPNGAEIDRALLTKKADELDQRIGELTRMRDGLRHAAKCPASSHFECPSFQRYVKFAGDYPVRKTSQLRNKK